MKFQTVPITLITGYLGSGKTTLINHILKNANNHHIAVIVNDLGEVNIDAELIEKGGVVSSKDDNLVALQNGCICCTLKKDLLNQLADLVDSHKFDHILIEASGICEPFPIAQSIMYMEEQFARENLPKFYKLDAIISVTDALRLRDEFGCGKSLETAHRGEEDLENLVIQQIEFCDIVLLNKVSNISKEELEKVKITIKALQPQAEIIETDYCKVDIDRLLDTNLFDMEKDASSATWIQEFESWDNESGEIEEEHHHKHHDRHRAGGLLEPAGGIGIGHIGQRRLRGRHQDHDQVQLLHDADQDQHQAAHESVFGQGEHDPEEPPHEPGARDLPRLLQLRADLQHIGRARPGSEGQVFHDGHQHQHREHAVQGGDQGNIQPEQIDLRGCGEHRKIHGAEGDGRDQVGDEHHLLH